MCPKCKTESQIFPPTTGGATKMAEEMKVPFLGKLPLDPRIGEQSLLGGKRQVLSPIHFVLFYF